MAACSLYKAGRVCHYSIQHWHFLAITALCYCVNSVKFPSKNLPRMVDLAIDKSTGTKHDIQGKAIKEGCSTTNFKFHTLLIKKSTKNVENGPNCSRCARSRPFCGRGHKSERGIFFTRNYFILARPLGLPWIMEKPPSAMHAYQYDVDHYRYTDHYLMS